MEEHADSTASLSMLLDKEASIVGQDQTLAGRIRELDALLESPERKREIRRMQKALGHEVDDLERRVNRLKLSWENARIPDGGSRRFMDLKTLQMLTWLQSLREWRVYLDTLDPTFRAHAAEHRRQTLRFRELAREALAETDRGETGEIR